jgi:hypothetical protein
LRNDPILAAFLKRLRDEDDPSTRAYPANLTIIRALLDALDLEDAQFGRLNQRAVDLIIVAFYWLLRPAEYLHSVDPQARSQAFRFCDIYLTIAGTVYNGPTAPLNDESSIQRITHGALSFSDQKNAVRGKQVGHATNNDPFFCPAKSLGRIARRMKLDGASPESPIHYHTSGGRWYELKSSHVTNSLRHAADLVEPFTGIPGKLLSARSLRPGGATALLCAGIDKDHIQLLGRWQSDAMFRYLRIQAATTHLSQRMLDHGSFTFAPGTYDKSLATPVETPANISALLAHEELYSD